MAIPVQCTNIPLQEILGYASIQFQDRLLQIYNEIHGGIAPITSDYVHIVGDNTEPNESRLSWLKLPGSTRSLYRSENGQITVLKGSGCLQSVGTKESPYISPFTYKQESTFIAHRLWGGERESAAIRQFIVTLELHYIDIHKTLIPIRIAKPLEVPITCIKNGKVEIRPLDDLTTCEKLRTAIPRTLIEELCIFEYSAKKPQHRLENCVTGEVTRPTTSFFEHLTKNISIAHTHEITFTSSTQYGATSAIQARNISIAEEILDLDTARTPVLDKLTKEQQFLAVINDLNALLYLAATFGGPHGQERNELFPRSSEFGVGAGRKKCRPVKQAYDIFNQYADLQKIGLDLSWSKYQKISSSAEAAYLIPISFLKELSKKFNLIDCEFIVRTAFQG